VRRPGIERVEVRRVGTPAAAGDAYYVIRTADTSLPNAQNLGVLSSGILKHTVSSGVSTLATATAGTDYESPLTFASGLTRAANTVTGDYITGATGNHTWTGSTDASGTLTIRSTSNGTQGALTLSASQVLFPQASTGAPGVAFTGKTNCGLAFDNAAGVDRVHLVTGGVSRLICHGDELQFDGPLIFSKSLQDVQLHRDGSGELGLRRAGNAQKLHVYNTYTSSTVYERGVLSWSSDILTIGAEAAGGGTLRGVTVRGSTVHVGTGASPGSGYGWSYTGNRSILTLGGTDPGSSSAEYLDVAPASTPSAGAASLTYLYTARFRQQTFANSGTANTLTQAATVFIDGPPTFTGNWTTGYGNHALRVDSGQTYLGGRVRVTDGSTDLIDADPQNDWVFFFGAVQTLTSSRFIIDPPDVTVASSPTAGLDEISIQATTTTITGTTAITNTAGFNLFTINAPTYTDSSAVTITHAATVRITGAPIAAGSVTITNAYALWIDSGRLRYDGQVANGGGGAPTFGTIGGSGPTATAQSGWLPLNIDGNSRFIPVWA